MNSEQQYLEARERVVREAAEELGMEVDEVRNLVDDVLGKPEWSETPWEVVRKTPKPPKGLAWPATLQWYRDNAHEAYKSPNGWTHYVLKSYQKDRQAQYARALCLVDGYESEIGDVYWREITSGQRIR